jgi:hypothetical protein
MKKRITWTDEAKADIRRIEKEQALAILKAWPDSPAKEPAMSGN